MAKINAATQGVADATIVSLAASVCLLMCMVVSLLGIKIWWFKHRLTFDHAATSNGAAGGTPPAVPVRQKSSKDKRASEQYRASVEVHGVFRKRQEDDMDFVRPTALPPVRIRKISKSTPSLLPPPRRQEDVVMPPQAVTVQQMQPPTREPPPTPIEALPLQATQTAVLEPSFEKFQPMTQQPNQIATTQAVNEEPKPLPYAAAEPFSSEPPQPPKRLYRSASIEASKAKSLSEQQNSKGIARRPTGHTLGVSAEDLHELEEDTQVARQRSVEVFGERRATGYIKYEEVDVESANALKAKNVTLQTDYSHSPSPEDSIATVYDEQFMWQTVPLGVEETAYKYEEPVSPPESSQSLFNTNNSVQIVEIVDEPLPETKNLETNTEVAKEKSNSALLVPPRRKAKFPAPASIDHTTEQSSARELRGPKSLERADNQQLWQELEQSDTQHDPSEERLWLEMQQDINTDFASHIEEEFDKIRHSYQENEGAFLELERDLEPTGFGKSIDDDWANFEELQKLKENATDIRKVEVHYREVKDQHTTAFKDLQQVSFKLPAYDEYAGEKESRLHTERRPTAYVQSNEDLYEQWQREGGDDFGYQPQIRFDLEEQVKRDDYNNDKILLDEFRPASQTKRVIKYEEAADLAATDYKQLQLVNFNLPAFDEYAGEKESVLRAERRPTGYVRTTEEIYEEWKRKKDNDFGYQPHRGFEVAEEQAQRPMSYTKRVIQYKEVEDLNASDYKAFQQVSFKLPAYDEYAGEKQSELRTERRPTGYVRTPEEFYEQLQRENDEFDYQSKVRFNVAQEQAEGDDDYSNKNALLSERRPTGYTQRVIHIEDEHDPFEPLPPAPKARQSKPRAKVTFDFKTEEHHYPAGYQHTYDSDEDEEDEEFDDYPDVPTEIPKPMQRLAKIHYTDEGFEPVTPTPPILFSTQVSLDGSTSTDGSDSWSAIRQHRYLTEEFQQLSLQPETLPAPREAPRAAYRNPLAQMAMKANAEADYVESRTTRNAPQMQARQYDFESYPTTRSTEA